MAKNILNTLGESIKPPVRRFADGGTVETPEQLIARVAKTYGTGGKPADPTPAPAPEPKPAPPERKNIFSLIAGRGKQIDKALEGYANGGKIKGPGTPTSDSIPAQVKQTGEPIKVSTDERILSGAQDALLEAIARGMGYSSLDELLEKGTGKPVGPVIKGGKRAAANGADDIDLKTVQSATLGQQSRPAAPAMNPNMASVVTGAPQPTPAPANPLAAIPSMTPPVQNKPTPAQLAMQPERDFSIPAAEQDAATQAIANKPPSVALVSAPTPAPVANPADKFNAPDFSLIAADPKGYERTRQTVAPTAPTASQAAASVSAPAVQSSPVVAPAVGQKTFGVDYANPLTTAATTLSPPGTADAPLSRAAPTPAPGAPLAKRVGNSFTERNTAETSANPLTTVDMATNNRSLAATNAIRQSILDGEAGARFDRGADAGVIRDSGRAESQALMDRWGREDAAQSATDSIINNPRAAQALAQVYGAGAGSEAARNRDAIDRDNHVDANATIQRGQDTRLQETGMQTDVTARGQDIAAQTQAAQLAGNPLDQALKAQQIQAANQSLSASVRHAKLVEQLDATANPEQRRLLIDSLLAEQGKNPGEHRYIKVDGGEYADPNNPMGKLKAPAGIFDSITQKFIPMDASGAKPTIDVKIGIPVNAPDGTHTFQGKTITVKSGKVTGVA